MGIKSAIAEEIFIETFNGSTHFASISSMSLEAERLAPENSADTVSDILPSTSVETSLCLLDRRKGGAEHLLTVVDAPAAQTEDVKAPLIVTTRVVVEGLAVIVLVFVAVTVLLLVAMMSTRSPHVTVSGKPERSSVSRFGRSRGRSSPRRLFIGGPALRLVLAAVKPGDAGMVVVDWDAVMVATIAVANVVEVAVFVTETVERNVCVVVQVLTLLRRVVVVVVTYTVVVAVIVFGAGWTVDMGVTVTTQPWV